LDVHQGLEFATLEIPVDRLGYQARCERFGGFPFRLTNLINGSRKDVFSI